ncbi:MAG: hypothetical protein R3Y40_08675 [Eubacteriales bacterium]
MDWVSKLERKYGKYSVPNLMQYLIILQAGGFLIRELSPEFYYLYLPFDASQVLHGQVWRIVTFLMEPPSTSIFYVIISFLLYYKIAESLEHIWRPFRFNLYLLSGVLFHIVGGILVYLLFGISFSLGTEYLYLSLFFAFACSFPDMQLLLFFVLPVKVKYLGYLNGAFFAYTVLQGILPSYTQSIYGVYYQANAVAAFVSLLNFTIFYFTTRSFRTRSPKQMMRQQKFKQNVKKSQRPEKTYVDGAKHKCTVCGRTELDDPTLEFRYCSKCNGNYEYCQDHLFTHEHIK